jgi:inhibitor of cysteine peptidase
MKHGKGLWIALVLAMVIIAGSGCALLPDRADAAEDESGGILMGIALVDSVEPLVLESSQVQVQVLVRGNLPDDCTTLDEASVTREGTVLKIKLPTVRPASGVCAQVLEPYEQAIPLDVEGLAAGLYTVRVNGVSASFELTADPTGMPRPHTP